MPRESKKGACSSHTVKAKANCLQHVRRDYKEGCLPSYINPHLTCQNRTIYEDEMIKGRKSIYPLIKRAETNYTEKTGQKCQATFAPFREAVLVVKADVTNEQILKFKEDSEKETGWKCIGLWLHLDEGYVHSKYIEGDTDFKQNVHVHCLYDCVDHATGKAIRSGRDKLSHMQDILANATGMERGYYAWETGRKHRKSAEERAFKQEARAEVMDKVLAQKQSEINDLVKATTVPEEDMEVLTIDKFSFCKAGDSEKKPLTIEDLFIDTQKAIDEELTKPIPTFGQKEWREERLKEIRKLLRRLQNMLKSIGELQKESIAKVRQSMYRDAKRMAAEAIVTKQENERLENENRSLDKEAVAREQSKTNEAIVQREIQKARADKAEQLLRDSNHIVEENTILKTRLLNLKTGMFELYDSNTQNAINAIIERCNAGRFTVEQKKRIDAALSQEKTIDGKISVGKNLVNIARLLMEEPYEITYISQEIEHIAEGTWQPVNIQLRDAAVNAIITRTEDPGAKHFTVQQYNTILAYVQDSDKSAPEAISELWSIAEKQINAIDGWKALTLRDLQALENGECPILSTGMSY